MATKTWKLGERCNGGIIQVIIKGNAIAVIGKEWDFSQGTKKGSNQKNAKEWSREIISVSEPHSYDKTYEALTALTSSGYADIIHDWIESHVDFNQCVYQLGESKRK